MILKSKITALDAAVVCRHLQRVCLLLRQSRAPSPHLGSDDLDATPDAVVVHHQLQRVCLLLRQLRAPSPHLGYSCPDLDVTLTMH